MARPTRGSMYSTKQVGNTETAPADFGVPAVRLRFLNHVVKRCLAYGGRIRSDARPAVFSMTRHVHEPGVPFPPRSASSAPSR